MLFFIKSCLLVFLSVRVRVVKRFLGNGKRRQPLLFLLSRAHGPAGTAPNDSYGHSQETGAPNLQTGLLPAPVRLRARAVSTLSRSVVCMVADLRPPPVRLNAHHQPAQVGGLHAPRCASATNPRPVVGRWQPQCFLSRAARVALALPNTPRHFLTRWQSAGLPEHHAPGQFHQGRAQAHVTVFSDRQQALGVTAGADPATETSIAAHLPTVVKAFPVTHLPFPQWRKSGRPARLGRTAGAAASSASAWRRPFRRSPSPAAAGRSPAVQPARPAVWPEAPPSGAP